MLESSTRTFGDMHDTVSGHLPTVVVASSFIAEVVGVISSKYSTYISHIEA